MEAAGLVTEGLLARGDFTYDSGLAAANTLLARGERPTAIVASSDQMTLASLEAASKAGLSVPRDLSLISFDNTPIVRFSRPALTAVDQPIAATVARAVELLIKAVKTGERPDDVVTVSGALIERSSTAPPPV